MKTRNILFASLLSTLLIISCDRKQTSYSVAESENIVFDSTSSVTGIKDPDKKFIHTADINVEVKDALKSTLTIEKNVTILGGYVAKSELKSTIISEKITPISKDSARETKIYSVTNFMEIRVPKINLNDFLLSLNQEIGFVTSRNLDITDVTTEAKILEMKKTSKETDNGLKIINENNYAKKNELNDQIKYATVTLALIEKESIKQSLIANTKDSAAYENSNLGYQLQTALNSGGHAFQILITTLFYLWPLWILLIIGYFLYKKYKKQNKPTK